MTRGLLRLLLASLVAALWTPAALVALALGALSARTGRRATGLVMHIWARMLCVSFGIRVHVTGERPPKPALVAPNHVGYVDIVVLGAVCHGFFVSRADVRGWPVLGALARLGGTIFLERERRRDTHRATGAAERVLREGARLVVFLEGRAGPGDVVLPFRSSLLQSAVETGAPCVPVALRYTLPRDPDLDPRSVVAWHDNSPFTTHAWRLLRARRIDVRVDFLAPRSGSDRKALAAALEADVRSVVEGAPADVSGGRSRERRD